MTAASDLPAPRPGVLKSVKLVERLAADVAHLVDDRGMALVDGIEENGGADTASFTIKITFKPETQNTPPHFDIKSTMTLPGSSIVHRTRVEDDGNSTQLVMFADKA